MATFFLPATVLRSSGEWPCTSALGLLTRKYSAVSSKRSPLSKATVSTLRSLCSRSSVGQGLAAPSLNSISVSVSPGWAVADAIGALGRRLDVEIDHADAARLEHGDALGDRGLDFRRGGDRSDADGTLRLRQLGDVRRRVVHTQPDPTILRLAPARARHGLLMQLVVEIGAVVVDQHQQRDAVAHRGPDRRRTHAEVAVAEHRYGVTAESLQRERRADREPGPGAEPAATVLAEISEPILERPDVDRPAPPKRAEADVLGIIEFRAQGRSDVLHCNSVTVAGQSVAGFGLRRRACLPRLLADVGSEPGQEVLDHGVAGRRHRHVDRRQRLIFHVGAGMQALVEGGG